MDCLLVNIMITAESARMIVKNAPIFESIENKIITEAINGETGTIINLEQYESIKNIILDVLRDNGFRVMNLDGREYSINWE